MRIIPFCLLFFVHQSLFSQVQISGYIKDSKSQESLQYGSIRTNISGVGAVSNEYGYYSFTIPANVDVTIYYSYVGYTPKQITVNKSTHYVLNIYLESNAFQTNEVVITKAKKSAPSNQEAKANKMSVITLPAKNLKTMPSIGGEVDVLKVIQLLPGVAQGREGGTGMFVRGGDADQNLVLLDEATVYNVGHLFGFFSVFNPDAIKDLTLTKGAFPAYYGGRLSSVLDIRMNEGNANNIHGTGGVGMLSSRLTIEGPIIKDKMSFLIAGRRSYIDQVLGLVGANVPFYFYDLNAKVNYTLNHKNRFYLSSYFGDDVLKVRQQVGNDSTQNGDVFGFGFNLRNITQTLRWNHLFSDKIFSNTSLIHTLFNYDVYGKVLDNSLLIKSEIRDIALRSDITNYIKPNATLRYGTHLILHNFKPNVVSVRGQISDYLASQKGASLKTFEAAFYADYEWRLDTLTTISGGLRFSSSIVKNKTYLGPEPRISAKRDISKNGALKLSYSRMKQYMHRVSNSSVALPTDLWYPISSRIKPQNADQIAFGYHLFSPKLNTFFSVEAYHKWMRNLIEYHEGTNLILNNNFEDLLVQGKGKSYGVEFLAKKDEGNFNGWIGYTLSWSKRQFDALNGGKEFWAKYDRRHDFSVVANYKINRRQTLSAVWVYSTGYRFTPMVGQYFVPNSALTGIEVIPIYTERNAVALNSSHRLDLNWVIKTNKTGRYKSEWHIGGYNIYNRATPYTIKIVESEKGGYKYEQPGFFGFIPSIAYNFNF